MSVHIKTYTVAPVNDPKASQTIKAHGFYVEEGTGAVVFFAHKRDELIARLFNVSVMLCED